MNTARRKYNSYCRNIMLEHLKANPCVDCGEGDVELLQFDHKDPSTKHCAVGSSKSIPQVLKEISKCEVRCYKCHKLRTKEQHRLGMFKKSSIATAGENLPLLAFLQKRVSFWETLGGGSLQEFIEHERRAFDLYVDCSWKVHLVNKGRAVIEDHKLYRIMLNFIRGFELQSYLRKKDIDARANFGSFEDLRLLGLYG